MDGRHVRGERRCGSAAALSVRQPAAPHAHRIRELRARRPSPPNLNRLAAAYQNLSWTKESRSAYAAAAPSYHSGRLRPAMARLVSRTTAKRAAAAALQTTPPPQSAKMRQGPSHSPPDAELSTPSKRIRRSSAEPGHSVAASAAAAAAPGQQATAITRPRLAEEEGGAAAAQPWPVPASALEQGRRFIARMAAVAKACYLLDPAAPSPILLLPDKDADGLSAGAILHRTLRRVYGVPEGAIRVHHVGRGASPASPAERAAMSASQARWIVVLDQGSRHGAGLTAAAERGWAWDDAETAEEQARREMADAEPRVRSLIIDHHHLGPGEEGPTGALMLNAHAYEPVATSALLTWCICRPLWTTENDGATAELPPSSSVVSPVSHMESEARAALDYLALIGTCGDLGMQVKWAPPWPDLEPELKRCTRKRIGEIVAAVNARAYEVDVKHTEG